MGARGRWVPSPVAPTTLPIRRSPIVPERQRSSKAGSPIGSARASRRRTDDRLLLSIEHRAAPSSQRPLLLALRSIGDAVALCARLMSVRRSPRSPHKAASRKPAAVINALPGCPFPTPPDKRRETETGNGRRGTTTPMAFHLQAGLWHRPDPGTSLPLEDRAPLASDPSTTEDSRRTTGWRFSCAGPLPEPTDH